MLSFWLTPILTSRRYGEVMDLHMPRDKTTGKTRGFGFLMYEDQRSTVLAVDNLNGAKVLEKTLRVDHVKDYKQPKTKDEEGEWHEAEEQSFNARPQMIQGARHNFLTVNTFEVDKIHQIDDDAASDSSASSGPAIDPEDPMAEYLIAQRREEKALKKSKKSKPSKGKHKKDETPEERRARKERKKEKKARKPAGKSGAAKDVEQLLQSLAGGRGDRIHSRSPPRSHSTARIQTYSRSRSPVRERSVEYDRTRPAYSSRGGFDRDRRSDRYDDRERDSRSRRGYDNDRGN